MSDWQERITHETAPAIRAEHELRYRIAAPVILAGGPWADLGCGNGLAASVALGAERPSRAVLLDVDGTAVERAASELGLPQAVRLVADLTDPRALEHIGAVLLELGERPVVTCFEVVEHLSTFLPLVEWSVRLASEHSATFVISVPNDAFWAIENPHHLTAWSEGAFEELCQLLPSERTLLRQIAVTGSATLAWDEPSTQHPLTVSVGGADAVATHLIAAFGPRHSDLWCGALAVQADQLEQRRWERQRESNVALARAAIEAEEQMVIEQREQLRQNTAMFEEWRTYIHELERELGRPLSGSAEAMAAERGAQDRSG